MVNRTISRILATLVLIVCSFLGQSVYAQTKEKIEDVIVNVMTFPPGLYKSRVTEIKPYFTAKGYTSYVNALEQAGYPELFAKGNYGTVAKLEGAVFGVESDSKQVVGADISLFHRKGSKYKHQKLCTMVILHSDNKIDQIIAVPKDAMQSCQQRFADGTVLRTVQDGADNIRAVIDAMDGNLFKLTGKQGVYSALLNRCRSNSNNENKFQMCVAEQTKAIEVIYSKINASDLGQCIDTHQDVHGTDWLKVEACVQ